MNILKAIRDWYNPPVPSQPQYLCAKHGEVRPFGIRFGASGHPAEFCTRCLCEFLEREFPITKEKNEKI